MGYPVIILHITARSMQLLFTSPNLTEPTADTLREYASQRFIKLQRYLPKFEGEYHIRISVTKERHLFVLSVELSVPKPLIVKVADKDLRVAVDKAYSVLKTTVVRNKNKRYGK